MILFRADGNPNIGSGHVMRCLSMADAFRKNGIESIFVMSEGYMKKIVEDRGYSVKCLNGSHDEMEREIPAFEKLWKELSPQGIIVDSYFVTNRYFMALKGAGVPVWYVDDYGNNTFPVDGIYNYNVYGPDLAYEENYQTKGIPVPKLLLGLTYAPVREVYRNVPPKKIGKPCREVLVSTGATDPIHAARKLSEYLSVNCLEDGLRYHFPLTDLNQDKAYLLGKKMDQNRIVFHAGLSCLKELILSCDLALSASGSTLYELCACGLPTINYALADNQLQGCMAFCRNGVMESCGDLRGKEEELVTIAHEAIQRLASDYDRRRVLSERMQTLVDGNGADRFVKCFCDLEKISP